MRTRILIIAGEQKRSQVRQGERERANLTLVQTIGGYFALTSSNFIVEAMVSGPQMCTSPVLGTFGVP